jgi:hypothetical protein
VVVTTTDAEPVLSSWLVWASSKPFAISERPNSMAARLAMFFSQMTPVNIRCVTFLDKDIAHHILQ